MKINLLLKLIPALLLAIGVLTGCGGDKDGDGHKHKDGDDHSDHKH